MDESPVRRRARKICRQGWTEMERENARRLRKELGEALRDMVTEENLDEQPGNVRRRKREF